MSVRAYRKLIASTGSSGSATGSAIMALPPGKLLALHVDYNASAPGTTDLTFTAIGGEEADRVLLTLSNKNADGWFFPTEIEDDSVGVALASYRAPVLHNGLLIEIADADALSPCVTIKALYEL